jgi:hypothetical protein
MTEKLTEAEQQEEWRVRQRQARRRRKAESTKIADRLDAIEDALMALHEKLDKVLEKPRIERAVPRALRDDYRERSAED